MANKTTNYGLTKPLPEEFYDIGVHNGNMDIVDGQLKSINDTLAANSNTLKSAEDHIKSKSNPHGVTAAQVGAQPVNNDLTEYKDGVLRTISGVTVQIDSSPVKSVNGKIGNVVITPDDVGAAPKEHTHDIPTKTSQLTNDSGFLTSHQDISGKLDKSGGTMTGALVAQNNANYTTKQVRNVFIIADGDSLPSGSNGDICLVYTP